MLKLLDLLLLPFYFAIIVLSDAIEGFARIFLLLLRLSLKLSTLCRERFTLTCDLIEAPHTCPKCEEKTNAENDLKGTHTFSANANDQPRPTGGEK